MDCRKTHSNCGCGSSPQTFDYHDTECDAQPCSQIYRTECVKHCNFPFTATNGNLSITSDANESLYSFLQKLAALSVGLNPEGIPCNFIVRYVTENSALLSWQSEADSFTVTVGDITLSTINKQILVEGLSASTYYDAYITDNNNNQSVVINFQTLDSE